MFVDLGFYLVVSDRVDLPYFHPRGHALPEHDIQKSEFPVDGGLDGQVGLAVAYHGHVLSHVVETLLHLVDFHSSIETVLDRPFLDELVFLLREFVVFFGFEILLPGDEFVLVQGGLLLVVPAAAPDIHLVGHLVLLDGELLLLHLDHGVAQDVLLLGELRLRVEDLQVKVVVAEQEKGLPGADHGTFLDQDFLHHPAFLRAELDSGHRLHLAAYPDVVVELSFLHFADADGVLVDPERT